MGVLEYVLGSVLSQVLLHQSIIGLEAKTALDKYGIKPDVIIGWAAASSLRQTTQAASDTTA